MSKLMVNYDLKREDGKFQCLKLSKLEDTLNELAEDLDDDQLLTIYVEVRQKKEFKEKGDHYRLKGPKGA